MSVYRPLSSLQPATDLLTTDQIFVTQSGVAKSATLAEVFSAGAAGGSWTLANLTVTVAATIGTLALSNALSITNGGTGATSSGSARSNLGLGTIATQDATAVSITGGAVDGTTIGGSSAAAGTFTTLNASGGGALTGTWTDLGTVTTMDLNGGTIDGTTIGGSSPAAATVSSLTAAGLGYPSADGAAGEVITTNGAGTLSFTAIPASGPSAAFVFAVS
jgi:hypothetical protein